MESTVAAPYYPLPQPADIPEREKEDAMGAYLMMFAAVAIGLPLPIINLIAAIIYYFINRGKSKFIHFHALQALLSQIPTTVINWVLVVWAIRIAITDMRLSEEFWSYAIFAGICTLFYFVMSMIAAYNARQGKIYYFLFFGKIAYESVFSVRPEERHGEIVNKAPYEK